MVPLCGPEPGLRRRVGALARQNYGGPVQILFGVRDAADPIIPVVRSAIAEWPDADITLHIDSRVCGRNRKIANLSNLLPLARHEVVVMLDSDIEVGPDYLSAVVGALQAPEVGVVTCLYHGTATEELCARLASMSIDLHFLPGVCFAVRFGLNQPCFGATIAMRRETLDRIGGLDAFRDELIDDYAIGDAVRGTGQEVAVLPLCLAHLCHGSSVREFFANQVRSARTIRAIDPLGSAGAVITHPLPLALVALLLGAEFADFVALAAVACRLFLCLSVEQRFGLPRHSYWLAPLHGLVMFLVFVVAFFGTTVVWRGYRDRVTPLRSVARSDVPALSWRRRIRDGVEMFLQREGR